MSEFTAKHQICIYMQVQSIYGKIRTVIIYCIFMITALTSYISISREAFDGPKNKRQTSRKTLSSEN